MSDSENAIDTSVPPSGPGCRECLAGGGWWVHLRRCAACGHVGCCDSSPARHAGHHFEETGHPIIQSFEPGEMWFYDFRSGRTESGPELTPPTSRPEDQPVPAPADRVPADWRARIHR
ncbi:UBP-type zinc finger domain-containing protein [Nocardiopsis lambiniae]|uniref:UBP-type zinc finger domain-containing protein n=1 Tax=Nocardiopsis lambiniae TaxID=3075539 RepID=A0ABU2M7K4_9ACTN|nr:UBP-type zinc finger domain-containing protein [Nocardiopsis sp. DSM 44743]MDT0328649.1 UBP-type zinc finger domain-containing protein [Nocardiopsis sp. DSM 44743]